jgi:hypothetical protein
VFVRRASNLTHVFPPVRSELFGPSQGARAPRFRPVSLRKMPGRIRVVDG